MIQTTNGKEKIIKIKASIPIHKQHVKVTVFNLIILGVLLLLAIVFTVALSFAYTEFSQYKQNRIQQLRSIDNFYNVQDIMIASNASLSWRHDEMYKILKYVYKYADLYEVDPYLALAISTHESDWFTLNNESIRGTSGEIGIYQVMPSTAAGFGYNEQQLKDLEINCRMGIYFISILIKEYKDEYISLRVYNGGRRFNIEATDRYAKSVIAIKNQYMNFVKGLKRNLNS